MINFLYQQLLERLSFLQEEKNQTTLNDGRIAELQLVIIRVQQLILGDLNKPYNGLSAKKHNEKMFKRFGQPEGEILEDVSTGKSLIDAGKPDINTDLKLTEKQIEALLLLDEEKSIGLSSCKVSGMVMSILSSKGLINLENYANGEFWELTDKGHEVVKLLKSFQNEKTHNKTT